jgi:hypothetical protein
MPETVNALRENAGGFVLAASLNAGTIPDTYATVPSFFLRVAKGRESAFIRPTLEFYCLFFDRAFCFFEFRYR